MATRLRDGRFGVRIPGGAKVFFFLPKSSRQALGTNQHSVRLVLEFFLGLKQLGFDVNHSPASAKVQNEWSYTSTFPIHLRGLDRGTFTSTSCTILSNLLTYSMVQSPS